MYQVIIKNNGESFFLRGTTWAFTAERGQIFETIDQATQALLIAQAYTKPKAFKTAVVIAAGFKSDNVTDVNILLERTLK